MRRWAVIFMHVQMCNISGEFERAVCGQLRLAGVKHTRGP